MQIATPQQQIETDDFKFGPLSKIEEQYGGWFWEVNYGHPVSLESYKTNLVFVIFISANGLIFNGIFDVSEFQENRNVEY